jgi:uncharacterized protein (TIGR02453 family)
MGNRYFRPAMYQFLKELEANNEKRWWEENRDRYMGLIRDPALEFISDFSDRLTGFSPHFVADAKTVGGSLMRPYRDMRFSPDKTPYKTNVGIQFRHESGKDVHAPGVYVHIEPAANFAGVGLWSPETKVAHVIRRKIDSDPEGWGKAVHSKPFTNGWSLSHPAESLKRVPAQYDADHPYADDLRLKSFIASQPLAQKVITSSTFADALAAEIDKTRPFVAFLCKAVGLPF